MKLDSQALTLCYSFSTGLLSLAFSLGALLLLGLQHRCTQTTARHSQAIQLQAAAAGPHRSPGQGEISTWRQTSGRRRWWSGMSGRGHC